MAAVYDSYAQVAFNLSCNYILSTPTPPIPIADTVSNSTTRSTYCLHWNGIALWANFEDLVRHYWNNIVSQADKKQYVFDQGAYSTASQYLATGMAASLEDAVKVCIDTFPVTVHYAAATGLNGALWPTDRHSIFQRWGLGIEVNNVAGVPDFIMATE